MCYCFFQAVSTSYSGSLPFVDDGRIWCELFVKLICTFACCVGFSLTWIFDRACSFLFARLLITYLGYTCQDSSSICLFDVLLQAFWFLWKAWQCWDLRDLFGGSGLFLRKALQPPLESLVFLCGCIQLECVYRRVFVFFVEMFSHLITQVGLVCHLEDLPDAIEILPCLPSRAYVSSSSRFLFDLHEDQQECLLLWILAITHYAFLSV